MADLNIGNSSSSVVVNAKHNGSVTPQINNTYDLGTSALRWRNIYGGTFIGSLNGNATTVGQGNSPNTAQDANNLILNTQSKLTFYSFNTDKLANRPSETTWGYLTVGSYSDGYNYQTFIDGYNGTTWNRVFNSGTWSAWKKVLDSSNYTSYTVTKTGAGASGTWGIGISGNAAGLNYYSIDNNLTVAQAKNQIRSKLTNKGIAAVVLGSSYIDQWNTDTASYYDSSVHSMIALNPGYDNTTYGHFLVAHYGDRDLCHIGVDGNNWGRLRTLLDSANYTYYTVTKTGGGASGTWGISISGNSATATKLATARTISLTGSVTGSGTFDGSGNLSIATTTNHTHATATTSANGFMSSSDKSKLDGIATGANKYSHPTYTSRASGLYKVTVDGTGHVSAVTAVAKADITALGIPSTNTTYSAMTGATTSAAGTAGLVPAPAKGAANRYLRSDGTWQVPPDTNTTYSVATTSSNGLMSSSDKTKLNNANINVYKMSNIDTVATGSSNYVDIGFCSGYNNSFGGTYICISISWQGYAIQFRMGQGASTVKTRCTNTSKQWTAWH